MNLRFDGQARQYLWAILALAIAVLLAYILLSLAKDDAESQPLVLMLPPSKWDAKILELDKQALDEAYIHKLKLLFDVWVREGRDNPERPIKGAAEARRAYVDIMKAIEMREQAIEQREQK